MKKKTKNRHGGYGLQVLLAVLMMIVAGVTPAQAEDWYVEKTLWDKEYNVKFTAQKYHYLADFTNPYFWTSDFFNMDNWHTYWEFYIKAYFYSDAILDDANNRFVGEISVVTSDDVEHLVATWSHEKTVKYTRFLISWLTIHGVIYWWCSLQTLMIKPVWYVMHPALRLIRTV